MESKWIYNSKGEIDLIKLFQIILKGKKIIILSVVVFGLIGLLVAVFSEKEFTASTTVVLQSNEVDMTGQLGGLAAFAGISIEGGNKKGISPSLYPEIIKSLPFQQELLKTPLKFSYLDEEISYREYYKDNKKSGSLSTISLSNFFNLFKKDSRKRVEVKVDSIYKVSSEDYILFNQLKRQLILDIDNKSGYIKISFSMPEALPSALMVKKVQELLQETIINYRIHKSEEEFKFIKERYRELKKDFEKKQAALASFRDKNQGLITSRSQSRLERLKAEYNLSYELFFGAAKQMETQRIKLKENTPVFMVIDPVSVPVIKSKPNRIMILVIWLLFGIFIGIGFVVFKKWIIYIKEKFII